MRYMRLFLLICLGWLLLAGASSPISMSDTQELTDGARQMLGCLSQGVFKSCDPGAKFHFPLYQYVPAVAFIGLGLGGVSLDRALTFLNGLALLGVIWVFWRRFRDARFWVASIVMATGPLVFYAACTLGEPLAAFAILLFTDACVRGEKGRASALAPLCAVTKETSYPFLFFLGIVSFRKRKNGWRSMPWILIALILGFALSSAFNIFRFGGIWNAYYSQPGLHVLDPKVYLDHFLGLLISPNGGLLVFWPTFCVALFFSAIRGNDRRVTLGIGCELLALLAAFSFWHTPFGWAAWGPRFLLPWLPSLLFLALENLEYVEYIGAKSIRSRPAFLWTLPLFALGLPHLLAFGNVSAISILNGIPSEHCPGMLNALRDGPQHYACMDEVIWPTPDHWVILTVLRDSWPMGAWIGAFYFVMILALIAELRSAVQKR